MGKRLTPTLIADKRLLKRHKLITNSSELDDVDVNFLTNPKPRCLIVDQKNKYFAGHKTMSLQVSHPAYGYVLTWSNCPVLLPKLLKQKRVAGHPWLICQSNGCPLTLGAYRKHFERRTLRELGTSRIRYVTTL